MLKKRFVVSFFFIFFLLIFNSNIFAKSGCCSSHDGVNCGVGAQGNGKVICNDGWRGSSCLYSEMVMCGGAFNSQPAVISTYIETLTPTLIPTKAIIVCSDIQDNQCPSQCGLGNDMDCCNNNGNYNWIDSAGCYPKQETQCSGITDGICPSYCDNGWDADCCEQNLAGYKWYENWGCYIN